MNPLDFWFVALHIPILFTLGIEDLRSHRIRNDFIKLFFCLGLAYIVFNAVFNGGMMAAADGVSKICLAVFVLIPLSIMLYLRQMGAGDVKLLGVLAFSLPGFDLTVIMFVMLTAILLGLAAILTALKYFGHSDRAGRLRYWVPIGALVLPALCSALAVVALSG